MEWLVGDRIVLYSLTSSYIEAYLQAFTQEVRHILHVQDLQDERAYLMHRLPLVATKQTYFYCICIQATQQLIGALEIRGQEYPGQLYTWLHHQYWGQHYFQEALHLVQSIYFMQTQAHYFTARVDVANKQSYKALKKAGFADYAYIQGAYDVQYELVYIDAA